MRRTLALILTVVLILMAPNRLPAPIQEVPDSPTPAPEHSAKPKPKRVTEPKTERTATPSRTLSTPSPAPPKRFAGTWSGIMPEVPWGNVPTELIVSENETTMEWRESGNSKAGIMKTVLNGGTLSARFPIGFTTAVWYISPRSDGVTATVRLTAFMNDNTAIFQRK
jgi:hypothetical protein